MARTQIQLPADGAGKSVLAFDFAEAGAPAPNAGVRHAQGLVVCDALGNPANVNGEGSVQVDGPSRPAYMASSFRLAGTATTPINLLTVQNTAGAARRVLVRRIAIDVSASAITAYMLQAYFRLWHRTGVTPTGGALPAKTSMDGLDAASQANTIIRFPASADGIAAAIAHALPARSPDRAQAHPQILTGASGWFPADYELHDYAKPPLVLNAGDTLLVAIAGAASATHLHYGLKVIWEEVV